MRLSSFLIFFYYYCFFKTQLNYSLLFSVQFSSICISHKFNLCLIERAEQIKDFSFKSLFFLFVYCHCPCILLVEGKSFSILFLYCIEPVKFYFISCLGGLYCNVSHYNSKKPPKKQKNKNQKTQSLFDEFSYPDEWPLTNGEIHNAYNLYIIKNTVTIEQYLGEFLKKKLNKENNF